MLAFVKVPMPLLITGSALVVLIAAFVIWFLAPAVRHWFRLRSIERNLRAATTSSPQQLKAIFSGDRQLLHLWKQYEETLHEQTEDRGGIVRTIAVRSTIPAETLSEHTLAFQAVIRRGPTGGQSVKTNAITARVMD